MMLMASTFSLCSSLLRASTRSGRTMPLIIHAALVPAATRSAHRSRPRTWRSVRRCGRAGGHTRLPRPPDQTRGRREAYPQGDGRYGCTGLQQEPCSKNAGTDESATDGELAAGRESIQHERSPGRGGRRPDVCRPARGRAASGLNFPRPSVPGSARSRGTPSRPSRPCRDPRVRPPPKPGSR